ncbi:inositol phospholipid synthesis and fat-storage-inducing TM-domain-containing protein [Mucor mucedo]|uniref:inositol phospholipid synthesis and fat-storage-inducing TM-domain-containing protein n=1 Tax=Mucor mucedo TaxID=29922 RepID=UPI0022210051|nr:inositol phospholipid synthesis and fat-storage-inducing TM-domain-containing protein [Mucor mucedo]KAI7890369.1 inositol phospholipid synthesis and fat-storage-inducing TM-domain-containing protein [Mucor mucedo]
MEYLKKLLKPHQLVSAVLYPATVFIAFLYATVGNPPETYFSNKRNVLNQFFVKIGWFWVTLVYFAYLYNVRSKRLQNTNQFIQGTIRYVFVTLYWYIMTQWLFGPSFIDRVYVLTGGKCSSLVQDDFKASAQLANVFQQQTCRRLGGQWEGGHDVSGHCVMLIHASLFFWEELSWMFYNFTAFVEMKVRDRAQYWSIVSVLAIASIWWFMLFMTGVYFHGHFEILSGAIFGVLGWATLYLGVFPKIPAIGVPSIYL